MRLTWRQFQCYQEAFTWLLNEQGDEGKQANSRNDLEFIIGDERMKDAKSREVEKANAKLAKIKERQNRSALH